MESTILIAEYFKHSSCEIIFFYLRGTYTLEMESLSIGLENYLQICCKNIQTRFKKKYGR